MDENTMLLSIVLVYSQQQHQQQVESSSIQRKAFKLKTSNRIKSRRRSASISIMTLLKCLTVVFVLQQLFLPSTSTTNSSNSNQNNQHFVDAANSDDEAATTAKNSTTKPTRQPDRTKKNPYEEGCLYSHGIKTRKRTCNSEDIIDLTTTDENELPCSLNDMGYMEIRIKTNNWESIVYEAWLLQILLSEILNVPTTIEAGMITQTATTEDTDTSITSSIQHDDNYYDVHVRNKRGSMNFYHPNASFVYGTHIAYEALEVAYSIPSGDCTTLQYSSDNNITCAHILPESWKGTQASSEIRKLVYDKVIEPPQTLGVLGLETWFVTKFTLEKNPSLGIYLGLQGNKTDDKRQLLADTFLRPTTWEDYCNEVSASNCRIPDNVTKREPQSSAERIMYYNEGLYTGYFRKTDASNCTLNPTTCTGHIADFPCNWDSYLQPQLKHLNIPLSSSGPEQPIGGYPYGSLVELWKAANATKSNLIMHYWTPEPLYQEFVGTDAEFIRITMPSPSQLCEDNRRQEKYQCSMNETLLYGDYYGTCEESSKNLYKFIVGNLFDVIYNNNVPEAIRNPAYDTLRLFQLTELQLGQIFDYYHRSTKVDENNISVSVTPREAVCDWVIQNLDDLSTFIPRSYPRMKRVRNSKAIHVSSDNESKNITVTIIAYLLGCIATILVLITAFLVNKNRTLRSIQFAQIEFLYLLLVGLFLVAIGSILVALQPTNVTCVSVIWFINLGYTLEFVPLIVKVAAVNKLVGSARRFRRVVLSRKSLFQTVLAISAVVVIFLISWTIRDPPTKHNDYALSGVVSDDGYTMVDVSHYCSSGSRKWDYIAVGWNTLLLLCATVLAFQTRTLQKDFNESQTLAFLIYSHFVFVVLRLVTVVVQQSGSSANIEKLVVLQSNIFSIDTIATIVIYFAPKFTSTANKNYSGRSSSSTFNNFGLNDRSETVSGGLQNGRQTVFSESASSRHVLFDSEMNNSTASMATIHQTNCTTDDAIKELKSSSTTKEMSETLTANNDSLSGILYGNDDIETDVVVAATSDDHVDISKEATLLVGALQPDTDENDDDVKTKDDTIATAENSLELSINTIKE